MKGGSGTMTNGARVTSATAVGTLPSGLRVMRIDQRARMDGGDALVSPSTTSWAVATTGTTNFSQDTVHGNPIFVLDEIDGEDSVGIEVDLAWTCPSSTGSLSKPAGYQTTLSAVGCSYAQKVVVRPRFGSGPPRLEVLPYGDEDFKQIVKLQQDDTFSFSRPPLLVEGEWLGVSNGVAPIRLDTIKVNGVSVCTTGTYNLEAE